MRVLLLEDSTPDEPWLDLAISDALLRRVAQREVPATMRLYQPGPTVAFGRLDALREGYRAAAQAARDHGFTPARRSVGGLAAAYTDRALVYDEITPQPRLAVELRDRFEDVAGVMVAALTSVGVDARVGQIPGEYCPGEFSISTGGTTKVVGIAQRVVARAALVSAVIVVADGDAVRSVLRDVNARLGHDWEPRTAGALADVLPGVDVATVRDAVVAQRAQTVELETGAIDPETLTRARGLRDRHFVG
jgi:octanoyl-[GcvH]:protein N-octanoyltransferase